jgi:hypothetical protein
MKTILISLVTFFINFVQKFDRFAFRISVAAKLVARRPIHEDEALANKLSKSSVGCDKLPASVMC